MKIIGAILILCFPVLVWAEEDGDEIVLQKGLVMSERQLPLDLVLGLLERTTGRKIKPGKVDRKMEISVLLSGPLTRRGCNRVFEVLLGYRGIGIVETEKGLVLKEVEKPGKDKKREAWKYVKNDDAGRLQAGDGPIVDLDMGGVQFRLCLKN